MHSSPSLRLDQEQRIEHCRIVSICDHDNKPFTLQVFPGTLLPPNYPDPDNPGRLVGRSEVERRTDYIQPLCEQLGEQHPLVQLVCQCLHNVPAQRPSAEELLQQLEALIKRAYGRKLVRAEMARLQVAMMAMLKMEETEVGDKDSEIEHLRHHLQQVQVKAPIQLLYIIVYLSLPCYHRRTQRDYK